MKVSDLKPADYNPRTITNVRLEALERSMREFGDLSGITFNRRTGRIVGGHQRVKHLQSAWPVVKSPAKDKTGTVAVGYVDAPDGRWAYREVDWTEAKEKAANIAANAHGGEFDKALLAPMLKDLKLATFDLKLLGLEAKTLDALLKTDLQENIPEPPKNPVTKPGDLIILGEHRLLCGDSTSVKNVEKLMEGKMAQLVFTDPPYGVGYDGGHKKREKLAGDEIGTAIYEKALPMLKFAADDKAPLYLWYADAHAAAAAAAGYQITAQIIWIKNNAQFMSSAKYHGKHEPCFYAHRKNKTARWHGPNNEVTVWECDRANKNEYHPTQKPVALAERAIGNSSMSGDIVLDLFLGSGSTLIACEQSGRKCYGLELSPAYCDVIIARWEELTGKRAKKV